MFCSLSIYLGTSPAWILNLSLCLHSYQEWLKKKKEKSRENMKLKKKEEILKEEKKRVNNPFCAQEL